MQEHFLLSVKSPNHLQPLRKLKERNYIVSVNNILDRLAKALKIRICKFLMNIHINMYIFLN